MQLLSDLKLLELLLGDGVEDAGRVGVGGRVLGHLQPVLEARVVLQELAPQSPRLLDAAGRQSVDRHEPRTHNDPVSTS